METIFFWASKLIWTVIAPDSMVLILLTIVCLLLGSGNRKLGQNILLALVMGLWLVTVFPVANWLLRPLETRFATNPTLPATLDGIIVLGGAESTEASQAWQQVELKAYAERALMFMQLARRYPEARLLFTGGSGSMRMQDSQEADIAKQLFQQQGVDVSRIAFERNSRNTYENALFGKRLVNPGQGEKWLLITSASHMPRAVGVFCQADWQVIPYPVDHWTIPDRIFSADLSFAVELEKLTLAVREWVGLAAYYMTGKTGEIVPGSCRNSAVQKS
ncbi:MAG: YdcF family protein [Gammaproteobacteria bacterium]